MVRRSHQASKARGPAGGPRRAGAAGGGRGAGRVGSRVWRPNLYALGRNSHRERQRLYGQRQRTPALPAERVAAGQRGAHVGEARAPDRLCTGSLSMPLAMRGYVSRPVKPLTCTVGKVSEKETSPAVGLLVHMVICSGMPMSIRSTLLARPRRQRSGLP